ncbi:MAG: RecQ family ATP-dependent DNA helicase [Bacteroidales bacterium]|nr:RecQ family ATP-dependent DNA helicase [Bacteroidales bacterium]
MTRNEAEIKLKKIFGFDKFYDEQWETIDMLLRGKKMLLIEKTGYGKSLCFQFSATQFDGITVIFSPLIALMRDQVNSLNEKGIPAKHINSEQTYEENSQVIQDAINGKIKILYIAPERQENQEWIEATRKMNLSMIVIDEAHTISVWGHDFRPAFRRIINLVQLLPKELPVLATTATATKRVQADIEQQISGNLTTIRGNLLRENFNLFVIETKSEDEKLLWLAENINKLPGIGLLYTGTRVNTEIYARWFDFVGINSTDYNAGLDGDTRKEIEKGLMNNKWKCVVSTNALGMGIDKPDIRFIIHTQIPASPIHYYQEIGRAGRDRQKTFIILFYNSKKDDDGVPEDYKLPKAFVDGGRPNIKKYQRVINAVKQEQLGERQLLKKTNMKQTQIRVIKADLIEQGIIKEVKFGWSKKYEYQFNAPELNTAKFDELRNAKLKDLDSMVDYVFTQEPRMKFLCEYLGDTLPTKFENCDNTKYKKRTVNPKKETISKLIEFRETYFPALNVESNNSNIKNGIASSYYGVSNVGAALHRCKYENGGAFPDFLLKLTLKAFRNTFGNQHFDLIVFVPPTSSGELVKTFAEKISYVLKIPVSHKLIKQRETQPQKVFQNGYLKRDNVSGAFNYTEPIEINNKSILLVDDIFDSGATIKEIGELLTNFGAKTIVPLVIARTVGGDI